MKVYTVIAYRYGNTESHSYPLGVFDDKDSALSAAELEEYYRGRKYECVVLEWEMNVWKHTDDIMKNVYKVIKGNGDYYRE
jgi:hypothetical protein